MPSLVLPARKRREFELVAMRRDMTRHVERKVDRSQCQTRDEARRGERPGKYNSHVAAAADVAHHCCFTETGRCLVCPVFLIRDLPLDPLRCGLDCVSPGCARLGYVYVLGPPASWLRFVGSAGVT